MNNFLHTEISDCIASIRYSVCGVLERIEHAVYTSVIDEAGESSLSKAGIKVFANALSSDGMSSVDLEALGAGDNFEDGIPRIAFRTPNVIALEGDAGVYSDDLPLIHAIKLTAQQDLPSLEIGVHREERQAGVAEQWTMTNRGASPVAIRVVRTPVTYESGVSMTLGNCKSFDLHYLNAVREAADEWAGVTLHHLQTAISKGWASDIERAWLAQVTDVLDSIASGSFDDLDEDGDDAEENPSLFEATLQAMRNMFETLTEDQYATINRLVIRSVARSQKRWADRGSKGSSAKLYKFVKENAPTSITPELAERYIKALLNDGSPAETQSEVFYNLGNFKRALEARIKTARTFDRALVSAEWAKACVKHDDQE